MQISDPENKVLAITKDFLAEMEPDRPQQAISLDVSLERDLGVGSLERVELIHRVEKAFAIELSDSVIAKINTLQDLLTAIGTALPSLGTITQPKEINLESLQSAPTNANTLLEVLNHYVEIAPNRPHVYLLNEDGSEKVIRYSDLFTAATKLAKGLIERGLKQGETVAIMLPTCEEFFYSFFGTLLAGGVPVPIYPPFRADQIEEYAVREAKILSNAGVRFLITFQQAEKLSKLLQSFIPGLKAVVTADMLMKDEGQLPTLNINTEDAALIQYTSGSTSDPKGVLLPHKSLLANLRAVGQAAKVTSFDRVVSWLPLYHDMGLIGTWLGSLYFGVPATIMSPLFFLNRPERWLWAIHYYRGTISAGPNFAYELCVRKIKPETIEGLDLSSWRLAFNGAEAIYAKTLERFTKRFKAYGLKPETIYPVYGLAESSVALSFPPLDRIPRIDKVDREIFAKEQRAEPVVSSSKHSLEFVACGQAIPGHAMRVVDDNDQILAERHIGNIQFQGPSSMAGYYRNPQATAKAYHDGWWSTGDLGYLADDEVFITGRKKDLIIKAGRNLHAAELEDIAGNVEGVRQGCVVAFGISDPQNGTEKLVIVAETNEKRPEMRTRIKREITEKIVSEATVPPDQVILVRPRTIPKTSSGKLRRADTKNDYLQGKLERRSLPIWLQVSKLFLVGSGKKIIAWFGAITRAFYTFYVALVAVVIILPLWVAVKLLPQAAAAKWCQVAARLLLTAMGCRITVEGKENLMKHHPVIFVANHASYVDTFALMTVLPLNAAFVGKKELMRMPFIKTVIQKLNFLTVDRIDFSQSLADVNEIEKTLQAGRSLVIFPEGTFTYATGLRPFKLGAFKIAVENNHPICAIALQGTRDILRGETWLLKPGSIKITVNEVITARDKDWSEVIRLRTAARTFIADHCGESTIDFVAAGPAS